MNKNKDSVVTFIIPKWACQHLTLLQGSTFLAGQDDGQTMRYHIQGDCNLEYEFNEVLAAFTIPHQIEAVNDNSTRWFHADNNSSNLHVSKSKPPTEDSMRWLALRASEGDIDTLKAWFENHDRKHLPHKDFNLAQSQPTTWTAFLFAVLRNDIHNANEIIEQYGDILKDRITSSIYTRMIEVVSTHGSLTHLENVVKLCHSVLPNVGATPLFRNLSREFKEIGYLSVATEIFITQKINKSTLAVIAPHLFTANSDKTMISYAIKDACTPGRLGSITTILLQKMVETGRYPNSDQELEMLINSPNRIHNEENDKHMQMISLQCKASKIKANESSKPAYSASLRL